MVRAPLVVGGLALLTLLPVGQAGHNPPHQAEAFVDDVRDHVESMPRPSQATGRPLGSPALGAPSDPTLVPAWIIDQLPWRWVPNDSLCPPMPNWFCWNYCTRFFFTDSEPEEYDVRGTPTTGMAFYVGILPAANEAMMPPFPWPMTVGAGVQYGLGPTCPWTG